MEKGGGWGIVLGVGDVGERWGRVSEPLGIQMSGEDGNDSPR